MTTILSKSTISDFQGKLVNWSTPAYDGNLPYRGSAYISFNGDLVSVIGDLIEYAIFDDATGFYYYSDFGRFITITDF